MKEGKRYDPARRSLGEQSDYKAGYQVGLRGEPVYSGATPAWLRGWHAGCGDREEASYWAKVPV